MLTPAVKSSSLFPSYNLPAHRGLILILVVNAFLFGSALLHVFSISGAVPLALNLLATLYFVLKKNRSVGYPHMVLIGLILFSTLVQVVIWNDGSYLRYAIFPVSTILILMVASRADLDRMVDAISVLALVVLLLAAIAFVSVFAGVEPLATLENRDGRNLYVFFSTLSNSYNVNANIVRPSGIYDEPGALSFFVCAIACLRTFLGKSERLTWVLLGLGLVTLSLAHVIYMVAHFLAVARLRTYLTPAPIVIVVAVLAVVSSGLGHVFYEKLILRFESAEGSKVVAGDNRSERLSGALDIIEADKSVLVVGIGPGCVKSISTCELDDIPPFSAAPLEPLILLGFVQGWLYYLMLMMLFAAPLFGRKYLVVFGVALLLLQRPYVMHIGYSFYSFLIFFMFSGAVIDYFRSELQEKRPTFVSRGE